MNKLLAASLLLISLAGYALSSPVGDIVINMPIEDTNDILKDNETEAQTRSAGYNINRGRWPNGVVPYVIGNEFTGSNRAMILESMDVVTQRTGGCITFVPRTNQRNFVGYQNAGGCSSWIGLINRGRQEINLNIPGCMFRGTIVHEIMHALGFLHEQNRPDRDNFVRIERNNIDPSFRDQFDKSSDANTFNTPYDFGSIMHYDEFSFGRRVNGRRLQTIFPLISGIDVISPSRRTTSGLMSDFDVQAVRARYCSSTPTVPSGQQDAFWCSQVSSNFCGFNAILNGQSLSIAANCPVLCARAGK